MLPEMRCGVTASIAMVLLLASCTEGGDPSTKQRPLRLGSPAPDFELPEARGGTVSLASFRGERAALLYFSMGPG